MPIMAQEGSEASVASSSSPNPNWSWDHNFINPFINHTWTSSSSSTRWPTPQTHRRHACDSTSPPPPPAENHHLWKHFSSSLASNNNQSHAGDDEHFPDAAAAVFNTRLPAPPPPFDYLRRMDGDGGGGDSWPESFMLNPSGGGAPSTTTTYFQYLHDSDLNPPWEGLMGCCRPSSSSSSWPAAMTTMTSATRSFASDVISFKPVELKIRTSSSIKPPPPPRDSHISNNKKPRGGAVAGADSTAGKKRKRSDGVDEAAPPAIKKSAKNESSSSSSSILKLQVPKVKLGERIAALQQIVSPFGRTDTASVLMEAINCIKFLQEQIQLLSDPYMKSGANKEMMGMMTNNSWGSGGGFSTETTIRKATTTAEGKTRSTSHDLKSRKLCLVPISCLPPSYRESSSATPADYWTPTSTFRGCTLHH